MEKTTSNACHVRNRRKRLGRWLELLSEKVCFGRHLISLLMLLFITTGAYAQINAITELAVIGVEYEKDVNKLKQDWHNQGWTVLNQDLSEGAGGWYIFLAYKTSSTANPETGYITDICASNEDQKSLVYDTRTYYKVKTNSGFTGNLNRGNSGRDIFLYYTTQRKNLASHGGQKRVITSLGTSSSTSNTHIVWRQGYSGACNTNKGNKGADIYIHQAFATQELKLKTEPIMARGLVYNRASRALVTATGQSYGYGTMEYKVGNGSWSTNLPTATNVGNYEVYYRLNGHPYANNSREYNKTVTIDAPTAKPTDLKATFYQDEKSVKLTWLPPSGNLHGFTDYVWEIYRDGKKITPINNGLRHNTLEYTDNLGNDLSLYKNGLNYEVYYVPTFWGLGTKKSATRAQVTANTTLQVPVDNFASKRALDRIVLTWTSNEYKNWNDKFNIYVDNEDTPIATIVPKPGQTSFQWEHRTTNQHTDRSGLLEDPNLTIDIDDRKYPVVYVEEPLNACNPHIYRIEGVIGNGSCLNKATSTSIAIGSGTNFFGLDATKGVFPGTVKLSWQVDMQGNTDPKTYVIERRRAEREEDPWVTLQRMSGNDEYMFYTDETPLPGQFYDYRVTVQDKCSNGQIVTSSITDIGFAQTTGTVSGRVTYGSTGSAVAGVDVMVRKTGALNEDSVQYRSMQFTQDYAFVEWKYPNTTYASDKFALGDFSLQMWIKPEVNPEKWIALFNGTKTALGIHTTGVLHFTNGDKYYYSSLKPKIGEYNHVTLTRSGKNLIFYLMDADTDGTLLVRKDTVVLDDETLNMKEERFMLGRFIGFVDEFRLWTKCLTEDEIKENYDHLLVGNEKNLETYWTFDEGLRSQFFDYSRDGSVYHQHHGKIGANCVSSTNTPSELALKAKTDRDGNYIIPGIPFTGEGTTYAIEPKLGIHKFNPTQNLRYVSNNSLVHNQVDFTDISSFPVKGTIFYAGTDYPVEGVSFYVDGQICTKDGEVIYSNASGEYEISVPIGEHFIRVVKNGHEFANAGRYPAAPIDTVRTVHNFDRPINNLDFYDETLVNFTGRVVGGSIEGNKPVGFGQSTNNIGVTEFVLTPVATKYFLNFAREEKEGLRKDSANYSTVQVASADPSLIQSRSWRGAASVEYGSDNAKKIYIQTDSLTGEFSAMVPPLQYTVSTMNLVADGKEVGPSVTIDLTNPNIVRSDTLYSEDGSDYELYEYNTMLKQVYHSTPSFTVKQKGRNDGSFGISEYKFKNELGEQTIEVYKVDNGTVTYNYSAPLFIKEDYYTFLIEGFEEYKNADNGKESRVPLKGNRVIINNALSASQSVYLEDGNADGKEVKAGEVVDLAANELALDDNGQATYKWMAGLPNIASPYTRTISINYDIEGRLYDWEGNGMTGIILGDLPTGNNFVTGGPDRLLMILRDPPGTNSSATWTSGQSVTRTELIGSTFSENFTTKFNHKFGFKQAIIAGTPVAGTINEAEAADDLTVGVKVEASGESSNTNTYVTTITTEISTSSSPEYVGDNGDVYVGTATNIIFGKARNVGFQKTATGYELGLEDIVTTGMKFGTAFTYTRYYIENILFPNWELMLNKFLVYEPNQSVIDGYVNNTNEVKYFTTLKPTDEDYGKQGTYRAVPPKVIPLGAVYEDSVLWVRTQIDNWTTILKQNEEAKVKAFEKRDNYLTLNRSFDSGSSVTYTVQKDTATKHTYEWNCAAGVVASNEFGFTISGVGFSCLMENETTGGRHESTEDETQRTTTFSYTLAEEGDDDAITVDVFEYDGYGPIFRTRGGQTCNPYEGKVVTKYYEPGTTIMDATMQIEVPKIQVDVPVMNDIPTGTAANYTLRLSNQSEIDEDVYYKLLIPDESNPNGANLTMDGRPVTDSRIIKIPAGQTITKALQLKQTNLGILDYDSIAVVLASQFQYDPTSTWDVITDTVYIYAHFVPSSSDVKLALSKSTLNTIGGTNSSKLLLTLSNFDRNYHNLKAFRVQYKSPGATDWTQLKEYVLNSKDKTDSNEMLPATGGSVPFELSMANYDDGDYIFRVVSVATYGADEVYRYSEELPLIKDMTRPRPLGQPEPADGVLDIGDDMSVTFNENIVSGELTKTNNFMVTGVLNGAEIAHETALNLSGAEKAASTDADIMLAGKDFSIDAWVNLQGGAGTLLSHGRSAKKLSIGTNATNQLVVNIDAETYTSTRSIPTNKWAFLTMNITADGKLSASVADDANETELFRNKEIITYTGNGPLTVGNNINGAIHELLLWDEAHNMATALANRSRSKSPSTRHLIGYWKMNEGEGTMIRDYARNRHMTMADETWYINNENKAVSLDGQHFVGIHTADLNVFPEDDGAIEFWVRGDKHAAAAQLLQMGEVSFWTNEQGELQFTTNGAYKETDQMESFATSSGNILDNAWHHIAVNILRQGATAVYVDGKRCLTVNGANVGEISTDRMMIGAKRTSLSPGVYNYELPFTGQVDEIRVWNATLNADLLSKYRKVRLTGKEDGLVVYYPFEKKELDSGNQLQTVGNDADLTGSGHTAQLFSLNAQGSALSYTDEAPALRTKPTETNVNFKFVASDNKIVVELDEDPAIIEGCTINLTVRNLHDANGNTSEPAIWSVFVNRKELSWKEDVITAQHQVKDVTTIKATMVNNGGKQQMWTLSGMPSWLTASEEYGSTNPRSETTVTFTVNPATPIGKYEETIYLKGNDGIEVPLTINFNVTGEMPLWSVNPRDFETSMNVIGRVELQGTPLADTDDLLAAFIGDECRGIARLEYKGRYDSYYATINIYGNSGDENKPISFRAFDALTGNLYPAVEPDRTINFEALSLIGKYADPVVFNLLDKIEQSTELKTGWNWISLNVKADDMKAQDIFEKIASDVITIKSQNNGWLMYEDGEWGGSMTAALNNSQMYAVQMKNDRTLRVLGKGVNSSNCSVTINPGWNWVSYYGRQVATVADALAGLQPIDGDILKAQNGISYFDTYEWEGSIPMMEPGAGYMVKSASNAQRTYGYSAITGARLPKLKVEGLKDATETMGTNAFKPVDFRNYSGNAIMTVQLMNGKQPMTNIELGIFVNGECRTAAVTDSYGMAFLTIPGDDSAELTFKIAFGDDVADVTETLTFEKDAIYGSPKNPIVINLEDVTGIQSLSFDLLKSKTIFDLQGRRISPQDVIKNNIYIIDGQKCFVK